MRPFKQDFESKVNHNMQEDDGKPGRAPRDFDNIDIDIKKGYLSPEPEYDHDHNCGDKKDCPPRFSTLFGTAPIPPPLPTPPAVREYQREYYPRPQRQRKSGVFVPMALFIVFAVILFFETTIIFAYTIIGLYNNAPSRIFPWAGVGQAQGAVTAYNCQERQGGINFAPNFILPGNVRPEAVAQLITITPEAALLPTPTTSTSTSTSSSSSTSSTSTTSTTSTSSADVVSAIASLLSGQSSTTPTSNPGVAIVTDVVFPPHSTTTVLTVVSVGLDGKPLPPATSSITSTTSSSSAGATDSWSASTATTSASSTLSTRGLDANDSEVAADIALALKGMAITASPATSATSIPTA